MRDILRRGGAKVEDDTRLLGSDVLAEFLEAAAAALCPDGRPAGGGSRRLGFGRAAQKFQEIGGHVGYSTRKADFGAWCERSQKESGAAAPDGFTKKLQILGSNLASTRERCTLTPPPEELELE